MSKSNGAETSRLMKLPVNSPEITGKMRCYRECDAMMAYYLSRGLEPSNENAKEIEARSQIIETPIDALDGVSYAELMVLHRLLAKAIQPALPKSIELFHFDAHNSNWNWLAPVAAIRTLVWITFAATVSFFGVISIGELDTVYDTSLLSLESPQVFYTLAFYVCLAALGACFSVLYDARRYVVEGTYDPRVGSNYPIRILLGIMSGVILSQLLFDSFVPTVNDAAADANQTPNPIGRPLAALLGGFSGQFVYTGLQKLVDSLTLVFSAPPEQEQKARERIMRAEMAEQNAAREAQRAANGAKLAADLVKFRTDPDKSAEVVEQFLQVAVGEADFEPNLADEDQINSVLAEARSVQNLGEVMLDVLPDDETLRIRGGISAITQKVSDIEALLDKSKLFEAAALAKDLKSTLDGDEPVREKLLTTARAVIGPAEALGLISNPAGVALSVLLGSVELAGAAHERWKALVLNAKFLPNILPPALVNEITVRQALVEKANDTFAKLVEDAGIDLGDNAALSDLGAQVIGGDDDGLFAKIGGGLARDLYDEALAKFQRSLIGATLEVDVPKDAMEAAGADEPGKLVKVIDALRGEAESESALQRILILADHVRETKNKPAEAVIKSIFARVAREALT